MRVTLARMTPRYTNLHYFSSLPLRCGVLVAHAKTTYHLSNLLPFVARARQSENYLIFRLTEIRGFSLSQLPRRRNISVRNRARFPASIRRSRVCACVRVRERFRRMDIVNNNDGSVHDRSIQEWRKVFATFASNFNSV